MSRDELPPSTPNVALRSFGTPSYSFQPLWTTPNANSGTPFIMGTGFQTYPSYLATPGPQIIQTPIKRSHKRKSDENLGHSAPKKPRKGRSLLLDSMTPNILPEMVTPSPSNRSLGNEELPNAHLDINDPDTEKLDSFFAFLQEKLKWTFGELLYHSSKGKSPGAKKKLAVDGKAWVTSNPKEVK
jgi:hypothetical protein